MNAHWWEGMVAAAGLVAGLGLVAFAAAALVRSVERHRGLGMRRYRLTFRPAAKMLGSKVAEVAIAEVALRFGFSTEGELVREHAERHRRVLERATGLEWYVSRCEMLDATRNVWMPRVFPVPGVTGLKGSEEPPSAGPKVWP